MRVVKPSVVEAALLSKGMTRHASHHHMFRKTLDGVTTLVTRISHGSDPIDDGLAKLMGKQCCLQLKEFWELVDCPLENGCLTRPQCGRLIWPHPARFVKDCTAPLPRLRRSRGSGRF